MTGYAQATDTHGGLAACPKCGSVDVMTVGGAGKAILVRCDYCRRLSEMPRSPGHTDDTDVLCKSIAEFLAAGLAAGQPLVVIATPDHFKHIASALVTHHLDEDVRVSFSLTMLDAEQTLRRFMVDGRPDPDRFRQVIGSAIELACARRDDCAARAYGEMADVLLRQGNPEAAVEVETLWNNLANTQVFPALTNTKNRPRGDVGAN